MGYRTDMAERTHTAYNGRDTDGRNGGSAMRANRNNQYTFVVPVAAFTAADVAPDAFGVTGHPFTRPCGADGRTDRRTDADGRYTARFRAVSFGARPSAHIIATPTADRNAVIVAAVAAMRGIGRTIAGRGRVSSDAIVAASAPSDASPRDIAADVRAFRAATANPATRVAVARRMIRDAVETHTADVPDAATAAPDADADAPTA